ncbi:MAG: 30S ribosomal protein S6 [Alphaproteobacteria bacterium]|nr:MAG: 30S ribosomal protein S6 [Alphaproteobacteria bacterium]
MAFYETVFIVRQDVSAKQVEAITEELSNIIVEGGGRVAKNEYWGLRQLAYRIQKNRKGHYVLLAIDAPSEAVKEMERRARLNEDIIRIMTVRTEELEEGPSVVMRAKTERGGRGRPRFERERGERRERPERRAE